MSIVHLLSTANKNDPLNPYSHRDFERLQQAVLKDRFKIHSITDDAEAADLIIFVGSAEPDFLDVRKHDYVRKFREKSFLIVSSDRIIPFIPGVYASIEKRWYSKWRTRSGFFLRVFQNESIIFDPKIDECPLLFSFLGSVKNSRVRSRIAQIKHPRGFVLDTSDEVTGQTDGIHGENEQRGKRYAEMLRKSKFILCPRGKGTSTWRLFETMKAGRVPVLISNQWVQPDGPEWNKFILRIDEKDVNKIPEILENEEHRAQWMGPMARKQWEQWFSEEVAFHRITNWCLDIKKSRKLRESLIRWPIYLQYLRPYYFRHFILGRLKRKARTFWFN